MDTMEFLNRGDRFAASIGAQLTEVREGYARAEMTVGEQHLNGGNVCQGGALFTLADLAIAAVMNNRGVLTFGLQNNISFLHSALKGDRLKAEAVEVYNHHKIPYVEVKVTNQDGGLICALTGVGYRTKQEI